MKTLHSLKHKSMVVSLRNVSEKEIVHILALFNNVAETTIQINYEMKKEI